MKLFKSGRNLEDFMGFIIIIIIIFCWFCRKKSKRNFDRSGAYV
jgi:hypothetical protein